MGDRRREKLVCVNDLTEEEIERATENRLARIREKARSLVHEYHQVTQNGISSSL